MTSVSEPIAAERVTPAEFVYWTVSLPVTYNCGRDPARTSCWTSASISEYE